MSASATPASNCLGHIRLPPFMIGPTGLNSALWPKGDILLAHVPNGIPFVLSTASKAYIEEVAAASERRSLVPALYRSAQARGADGESSRSIWLFHIRAHDRCRGERGHRACMRRIVQHSHREMAGLRWYFPLAYPLKVSVPPTVQKLCLPASNELLASGSIQSRGTREGFWHSSGTDELN